MSKRVFITGMGIVSALGNTVAENKDCLQRGQTGIRKASILATKYAEIFPFGEVPFTTDALQAQAGIGGEKGISRTEVLAWLALQQALKDAALSPDEMAAYDMTFLSASTVGGMSLTDQLYNDAYRIGPSSDYLASYNIGEHASNIIQRLEIKGLSTTLNTACSSSANAIMMGAKLIKTGRARRAIAGGTDALAKFTVNGFNALQILSAAPCKPFDKNRSGLTLGEGAAYLVLESEEAVGHKKIYGEVTGYGNAADAYHPSSISEDAVGIIASISAALKVADLEPHAIDYINAHGTGTINNDIAEEKGMHEIFDKIPPFQSTKTYTGHTLAAAGAMEAVFSLLAMDNSELYPSLHCEDPIDDFNVIPITHYHPNYNIKNVLSNSFGFGGNCSSLIFSKV